MTPGERCDEIMRLIDETLGDYAAASGTPPHVADEQARLVAALRSHIRAADHRLPRSA